MELTIVLSVPENAKDLEILETLESIPWGYTGVDLLIYSGSNSRIKEVIEEGDLSGEVMNSEVKTVFCETPEPSNKHHQIGFSYTKTDGVVFLTAGDIIEDIQSDLLIYGISGPLGFPGNGPGSTPDTIEYYNSRILPKSYRGIIFNTSWLKERKADFSNSGEILEIISELRDELSGENYWDTWGDYDLSQSWSVSLRPTENGGKEIENLLKSWARILPDQFIRELLWARIQSLAAGEIVKEPKLISKYQDYLFPENKSRILG